MVRDFQYAVVGARGKAHATDSVFQHFLALIGDSTEFPDQLRGHLRIRENFLLACESLGLPCAQHALAHRGGVFRGSCATAT
jgi:hypothetical protein